MRAKKASKDAKEYSIISIAVGIGMWILLAIGMIYYFSVFLPQMIETLRDQMKRSGTI